MIKSRFSQLTENEKIELCTIPQAVSVTQNPDDETYDQVVERQDKFLKLPENIKNKLVSYQIAEKIQRIGKHYNLELLQMASIARMIRNYYFKEVKKEDFANILIKEAEINQGEAEEISRYVIERIINTEIEDKSLEDKIVKMTLVQAMEKYPKVQDQIISDNLIKISGKEDMVKGSVRNWIKDYYGVVGAGNKDIMKRSSYIYHSQNAKNLNISEKQKLSIILKSLDENSLVPINTKKEEIVFNNSINRNKTESNVNVNNITKKDVYNIKKADIAFGSEKKSINIEKDSSDTLKAPHLDGQAKINHVQGNRFNLKSDHFEKSNDESLSSINNSVGRNKNESENQNNEMNVKFSAAQQLPVEKEEKKKVKKSIFFRRIKSVD